MRRRGEISFREAIVAGVIIIIFILVVNVGMNTVCCEEFRDHIPGLDEPIMEALIGTWEEIWWFGRCVITYKSDNTFDQTCYENGMAMTTQGLWMVRGGYIYYKDDKIGITSMRVLSINQYNTILEWQDGEICEGNRL